MFNQEEYAKFANEWIEAVKSDTVWAEDIQKAIDGIKLYRNRPLIIYKDRKQLGDIRQSVGMNSQITVVQKSPYEVLLDVYEKYGDKKSVCLINDGSYFSPAGGFTKGYGGAEEELCRVSGLYHVLQGCRRYADREAAIKTTPHEYRSEVVYTPGVPFTRELGVTDGGVINADVLTCASPNCYKVPIAKKDKYDEALDIRIEGMYVIPALHGANVLIIHNWGCGSHKGNPDEIFSVFNKTIGKYGRLYNEVIFAIPDEAEYKIFSESVE